MNRKEKKIQKRLGTLPVKEYLKDYIKFDKKKNIWFFHVRKRQIKNISETKLVYIKEEPYYPISGAFIDALLITPRFTKAENNDEVALMIIAEVYIFIEYVIR